MMHRRSFMKKAALAGGAVGVLQTGIGLEAAAETAQPFPLPQEGPLAQALPLRYRQVHLDFHTSGQIPNIGAGFDPEAFASLLKKASVNSVTCFGRCHHGYIYHPTEKFPERLHPHLKRPNLLNEQIEACHRQNIRVPIYVTVQWDEFTANRHPEWLMRDEFDRPYNYNNNNFSPGFYKHLCVFTPYVDFLKAYIAELFEKVPMVDGLFFDIHHVYPNANTHCIAAMRAQGLNAADPAVRLAFYEQVIRNFKAEMTDFVRKLDKQCAIFYNGGHVGPDIRTSLASYTHLELESLPSGGWGYLHFPLTARFARTLGKDVLGMTGKFHTSWGDFHSLKNQAALEFECFTMLALNAKCSVGDQLHPNGKLDAATYELIGKVYGEVARKEPWCENAVAVNDIAVFSTEEYNPYSQDARTPYDMMGAIRMLQEGKHQFDVIDSQSDLSGYKLLILPDRIPVGPELATRLEAFVAQGGSLMASYQSGLTPDLSKFASPVFGLEMLGEAPFSPDFLSLNGSGLGKGLPSTELVMYQKGMEVKLQGAEALLMANVPYFNRTWEHFSSHRHTPSAGKEGYPAVTRNGRVVYFMHPIFNQYAQNAPRWCRTIFLNALQMLLPSPVLQLGNAPSAMVATVNLQEASSRYVLHLLHYVPERRGNAFDTIEDVIPVSNISASVRVPKTVKRVTLVPQGRNLPFRQQGGRVQFNVPEVNGHAMVSIGF